MAVITVTEKMQLISFVNDKIAECEDKNMIVNTDFLDLNQQSAVINFFKNKNVRFKLFGGYENSERKMMFILPEYIENIDDYFKENADDLPISLLKISKDKFSKPDHRDYLGAVMGCSIRREKVGDILVTDDGCYIFIHHSMEQYLIENLTNAGKATLKAEKILFSEFILPEQSFKEVEFTVASLRFDSVVSDVFRVSRSAAVQAIEKGIAYINSEQILKPEHRVKLNDKIVLRGKGKAVITQLSGISRSGRIFVKANKYC